MSSNTDSDNYRYRPLTGLNFRELVNKVDKGNIKDKVLENNLYFTDTFSVQENPQDPNSPSSVEEKIGNPIKRIQSKLATRFSLLIERVLLFTFTRDFFKYVSTRLRVVLVLLSVLLELLSKQLEIVKKLIIKRMFWGRSNLFDFSVRFFSIFLILLIILSGVYRGRTIETGYQIASAAQNIEEKSLYVADTIVQGSSTKTVFNENANKYDITEYIVKGGDTLSTIAENHGIGTQTILWANDMSDSTVIRPGMSLKIPPGDGVLITVKDGDTLEGLASKYQSSAQNILIANRDVLEPPYTLQVGTSLFLPDGIMPEAPKPKPTIASAPVYSGVVKSSGPVSTGTPAALSGSGRWLGWPTTGGMLTQCFSGWHNGIDIADKSYPPVVAAAPGTVVFSGCQSGNCPALGSYTGGGWGLAWSVIIDHGNGFSTIYAHLNQLYVSSGQAVNRGDTIGQMGQTGLAYGVHVHFMLVKSGTWSSYNPAPYMSVNICGY